MFYTHLESVTLIKSLLIKGEEAAGNVLMSSSCLLSSASSTAPCDGQQDVCEGCVGLFCGWGEICKCCWKYYHRWSRDPGKDGSVQRKTGQLCSSQYTFLSGSLLSALRMQTDYLPVQSNFPLVTDVCSLTFRQTKG